MDDNEDYFGGDNDDYNSIDEDEEEDGIETDDNNKGDKKPQAYTILSEGDVLKRQESNINHVSSVLSVSKSWASLMLVKFQWNVEKVENEWFADEEKVRKLVGLVEFSASEVVIKKEVQCLVCFESCCYEKTHANMCGHRYCDECWKGYLGNAIKGGPGCLLLQCPDPGCCAAIDPELIAILVCDEYRKKYSHYLFRSYVEYNKKIKWCPAPGCEFAVEFYGGNENFDVSCFCSHQFCYNCAEERHRTVDCDTVSKWLIKNSSESENTNWIFVNSKPCPKCKRNIEKNQGCNHMTCNAQCGHQFCWVCLGYWGNHTSGSCNAYKVVKAKDNNTTVDEVEMRKEIVKQSLEKYTHYYERWLGNHTSMVKAAANLNDAQMMHLPFIGNKMSTSDMQLKFITEAWLQIIECRRVLKWTYAYGYYLPVHNQDKKDLFEYLQGVAESALEKLHECAEKDILVFLKDNQTSEKTEIEVEKELTEFGIKLETLTKVNKNYFDNLIRALENGLSEVNHGEYCRKQTSTMEWGKEDINVAPDTYTPYPYGGPEIYTPYTYGLPDGYIYSFSDEDDY